MNCSVCSKALTAPNSTCGNSYCQEAAYHRNLARNARKGSRAEKDHWARFRELQATREPSSLKKVTLEK